MGKASNRKKQQRRQSRVADDAFMAEMEKKAPALKAMRSLVEGSSPIGYDHCQFCGDPAPSWQYIMDHPDEKGDPLWPACWTCAEYVEKDNVDGITDRALRRKFANLDSIMGRELDEDDRVAAMHNMFDWFKEHTTGRMFHPGHNQELMETSFPEESATSAALHRAFGKKPAITYTALPVRPKWANARSFNKTFDSLVHDLPRAGDRPEQIKAGMLFSNYAFEAMQNAHLCVVEPEQVDAIEDMPLPELWRYATTTKAPWDVMYLDFEGYGGQVPQVQCPQGMADIFGAVVWVPRDLNPGVNLAIAPIGGAHYLRSKVGWNFDLKTGKPFMDERWKDAAALKEPWYEYIVMGIGLFGASLGQGQGVWAVDSAVTGLKVTNVDASVLKECHLHGESKNPEWEQGEYPGCVMVANDYLPAMMPKNIVGMSPTDLMTAWTSQTLQHADAVLRMCGKVLQTMFFMDNAPVEIAKERVSRQVRRQAERQGGQVGDIVLIRGKQAKTREQSEGEGGTANYSHRFMRRGHFRHLGSDAALASRPDLVTPCTRIGEAMCPHGECRKIWIDPVIVGDESLPLHIKSHALKKPKAAA